MSTSRHCLLICVVYTFSFLCTFDVAASEDLSVQPDSMPAQPVESSVTERRDNQAKIYYYQGVQAFQNKQYANAVNLFLKAREFGLDIPKLHFNLGSSYYKLQEYGLALSAYEQAQLDPQLIVLAQINSALCAIELNKPGIAEQYLNSALSIVQNDKYRQQILHLMDKYALTANTLNVTNLWDVGIILGLGYNTNVTLQDLSIENKESRKSDYYLQPTLFAQIEFWQSMSIKLEVRALEYYELDSYSYSDANFQSGYRKIFANWQLDMAAVLQTSSLAHRSFLNSGSVHAGLRRKIKPYWFITTVYDLTRYEDKLEEYAYLAGNQQIGQLLVQHMKPSFAIGLTIAGEWNDRQDKNDNEVLVTSHSPKRWLGGINVDFHLSSTQTVNMAGSFRKSWYTPVAPQISTLVDTRISIALNYNEKINRQWGWWVSYQLIDNNSSIDNIFSYRTQNVLFGLSWQR